MQQMNETFKRRFKMKLTYETKAKLLMYCTYLAAVLTIIVCILKALSKFHK